MTKCTKHSRYTAQRKPSASCFDCWLQYFNKAASRLDELKAAYNEEKSIRQVAKRYHASFHMMRRIVHYFEIVQPPNPNPPPVTKTNEEVKTEPVVVGRVRARQTPRGYEPGKPQRYLLTCAQNNTELNTPVWDNLLALADHYDARILVARTVYHRMSRSSDFDKKLIIDRDNSEPRRTEFVWDERLTDYLHDERLEIAPGLIWCGETNITPSAAHPMSGMDSYTGRASSVFPHPRIAMRSVPAMADEGTKFMYTTGTVTARNYIQRKAGQLAEFHHCYGALLVEVDENGTWFCRQINANSEGVLCDWDVKVDEYGHVSTGNSLAGITWGDIHVACGDEEAYTLAWGNGGILDQLRPSVQFMHDIIDFRARNGHNIKRDLNLAAFIEHVLGNKSVQGEMAQTARFLEWASRPDIETVVVDSNHDNFFIEWLERLGNFRKDHTNAVYFLEAAHHLWSSTERRGNGSKPNMTRWAIGRELLSFGRGTPGSLNIRFLEEDESYIICPDSHGGIECGLHGHEGFNGARGGPAAFARLGRKINAGHVHSAGIWDGAYFGGIMGSMNQRYNVGLGSWSQSNVFTYSNGKRAIQTIYNGKARA
jgi:hypothetical protein